MTKTKQKGLNDLLKAHGMDNKTTGTSKREKLDCLLERIEYQ